MANYQRIEKPICIMRRENLSHYFINFSLHKGSYNFYGVEIIRDFLNTVNQNFNPTTESKTFYACYELVYLNGDRSIRSFKYNISRTFKLTYFNDYIIGQIFYEISKKVLLFGEKTDLWKYKRFNLIIVVINRNKFFRKKILSKA